MVEAHEAGNVAHVTVRLADMLEQDAAYVRQGHTEVMLCPAGAHKGRFWPSAHCSCLHRHPPISSGMALHVHSFECNAPWVWAGHQALPVAADCKVHVLVIDSYSNSVTLVTEVEHSPSGQLAHAATQVTDCQTTVRFQCLS